MQTHEIALLLDGLEGFAGVFAADQFLPPPAATDYPFAFVVNTDPARRGGEHWIAINCIDSSHFEFFDSYAIPPSLYPSLAHNLELLGESVLIAPYPIQHPFSNYCGHYCVYFLSERLTGKSFQSILNRFTRTDLKSNDSFVSRQICARFNYCAPLAKPSNRNAVECTQSCSSRISIY